MDSRLFANDSQNENNVFYTVGNPIRITNQFEGISFYNYRKAISKEEVYESFLKKNIETVKLFKTQDQALEYSRFLRTDPPVDSGIQVYQRAVFKVEYFGNTKGNWQKKDLVINPEFPSAMSYDLKKREVSVAFFEVNRSEIAPLEGQLKIHGMNQGDFYDFAHIIYDGDGFEKDANQDRKECRIF
jgi:hypothetical protein